MEIVCSKTGSDGNFSFIYDGESYLAIDCGVRWEVANKMTGYKLLKACAALSDHCHSDHAAYISQFVKKGINVYATEETWLKEPVSSAYDCFVHIIDGSQFRVGTFIIKPFKVPHANSDGTPCENYGFLIYSTVTKEKMLWITDCAYIENRFPPCDYYCVECNYIDVDDYSKEMESLNAVVEKRRLISHLSLSRCIAFFKAQDLSKAKFIKLLHLTKTQGIIEDEIREKFNQEFSEIEVRI